MDTLEMRGTGNFTKKMKTKIDYGKELRQLMAGIYTQEELDLIGKARIAIPGVGGSIGSFLLDLLARKGFEHFNLAEFDNYEFRNMSRQLFGNTTTLGCSKLEEAVSYMLKINPNIKYTKISKLELETAEDFIKDATVLAYECDCFAPWVLSHYFCSKYKVPFVNVSRKLNVRTAVVSRISDYKNEDLKFYISDELFDSFGIPDKLRGEIRKMFDSGNLNKALLDGADREHLDYKYKRRFQDIARDFPEVGSIKKKYPNDYLKRYTDPELCFTGTALASRAVTDLVIGRKTLVNELDIFSRKQIKGYK